jgi:hypothetical protein
MRQFILLLLLSPVLLFGQKTKTTEQSFAVPASKTATMNLKFAKNIKVQSWDKNEIVLKTTFTYQDDDFEKWYEQKVDKSGNTLEIETGFKNMENRKNQDYNCWGCNNDGCYCLEFTYEIFAPAKVLLEIETISGDIEVPAWNGAIKAKSISGFIDVALNPKSSKALHFKSVTGEIYTDLEAVKLDNNSTSYSKKINTNLNGGGDLVQLQTVSGDIFLRKLK